MEGSTARHGFAQPQGPGVFEIVYMGRRMKVRVEIDAGERGLVVYGVPGHLEEGLPVKDFDSFSLPMVDDARRSATSNLSEYNRAMSRFIAGLTALRAVLEKMPAEELDVRSDNWNGSQFDICGLESEIALSYEAVEDRPGVEKAVEERIGVWYIEDRDGIPLPSTGPAAPLPGMDLNGREIRPR